MNKTIILCLIMGSILVIGAGCNDNVDVVSNSPYIGGTQGIVAEFEDWGLLQDNIETIWNAESFPVQINLKNKGEEAIATGDAEVFLKGIKIDDFGGLDETDGTKDGRMVSTEELEPVADFNKDGGESSLDFGDATYMVPITGSFYDVAIFADVIYLYKTHVAIPKVCFSGDPTDAEVCTVDEKKTVFSSGGPIQVISVEEKSAGKGLLALNYEVENVGGGDSTMPGEEFNPRYDQIAYILTPESEVAKWDCSSGGKNNQARLIDDKTTIRCKLKTEYKLTEDTLYTKQIGLEIEYTYKSLVHKQLRIKKED